MVDGLSGGHSDGQHLTGDGATPKNQEFSF
jgi:hypothetical protein